MSSRGDGSETKEGSQHSVKNFRNRDNERLHCDPFLDMNKAHSSKRGSL